MPQDIHVESFDLLGIVPSAAGLIILAKVNGDEKHFKVPYVVLTSLLSVVQGLNKGSAK